MQNAPSGQITVSGLHHPALDHGWFTPPDLDLLYRAVNQLTPKSVILVGGQSLSFWVDYFEIDIPRETGAYLTQDADFLGSKLDAQRLADALGADIKIAGIDDNTPNTAVLTYIGKEGKPLLIDFLSVIIGIEPQEIKDRATPFKWGDRDIYVLNPMLCLKSRIENLYLIPRKRDGNGISQAHYAVEVAKHHINAVLEGLSERDAIDLTKEIRYMSLSKAGLYVFREYGIDVLDAVDIERFSIKPFLELDWPNTLKWAERKRTKYCKKRLPTAAEPAP